MEPFLVINNLRKVYNPGTASEIVALRDLSLTASRGEFITVIGSNAAGKTTLFNSIAGSLLLDSGNIVLEGKSIVRMPEHERARFISRVWQNPNQGIIVSMSIAENLSMAKLRTQRIGLRKGVKLAWKKEFETLLEHFKLGLEKRLDDRIDLLSGGQKQIIALLMATVTHPKLLLLDEHTAALDPRMSVEILKITEEVVHESKVTTLMITHNISHALHYGDRLILLDRGRVVFEATGERKKKLAIADVIEKIEGQPAEFEEDIEKSGKP